MKIKTPQGIYPLSELADYHMERGPVAINRFNGSREIRVEAETVNPLASVPDILAQVEEEIMPELEAQFSDKNLMKYALILALIFVFTESLLVRFL